MDSAQAEGSGGVAARPGPSEMKRVVGIKSSLKKVLSFNTLKGGRGQGLGQALVWPLWEFSQSDCWGGVGRRGVHLASLD